MRTVGIYECCQQNGIPYLVKEKSIGVLNRMDTPEKVVELMRREPFHIHRAAEEQCYVLSLNTRSELNAVLPVSKGTVNFSVITPREIFIRLLGTGAVHFVMIHNHPSGDVSPSDEDMRFFRTLEKCGRIMNVRLSDFLIIGGEESPLYYSMKENHFIEEGGNEDACKC